MREYCRKLIHVLMGHRHNPRRRRLPKNQLARLAYITEFIEQAKVSGALQQAIEGAGSVALK